MSSKNHGAPAYYKPYHTLKPLIVHSKDNTLKVKATGGVYASSTTLVRSPYPWIRGCQNTTKNTHPQSENNWTEPAQGCS